MRKGTIVVSFSWVLVAIVGLVFLLLTNFVINKYEEYQDSKFEVEFKKTLQDVFRKIGENVGVAENRFLRIRGLLDDRKIKPMCVEGIPILKIDDIFDQNNNLFKSNPIFTSEIHYEETDKAYLATQRYKLPFVINNFFILTTDRNLIIFDDTSLDSKIEKEFIDNFEKSSFGELNYNIRNFSSLREDSLNDKIEEKNLKQITLVGNKSSLTFNLTDLDTTAYALEYDFMERGKYKLVNLTYHINSSAEKKFLFIDYDEDYAISKSALFANPTSFECSLGMINKSLNISYSFLGNKMDTIASRIGTGKVCDPGVNTPTVTSQYSTTNDTLNSITTTLNKSDLLQRIRNLEKRNEKLENFGCIPLY